MPDAEALRQRRRNQNDCLADLDRKGWYHSFELPDGTVIPGTMPLEWLRERWRRYPIPADLHGKRLLDIGAWDGWFSFEAERRGAAVTSLDRVEIPNYRRMHGLLGSHAVYRQMDFFEIPAARPGTFEIVLLLGVLYHLRHPLLALEILCGLTTEVAIVETWVTDGDDWRDHRADIPTMEFYETDELNGQMDNWVGLTVGCLLAMCRAAGFARVELLAVDSINASVACFRQWEPEPAAPALPPPELVSFLNATTGGRNFANEYVSCWFRTPAENLTRDDLCLQAGDFGAPCVHIRREPATPGERASGLYLANFRLPPATPAGWLRIRLRLTNSRFSEPLRIPVDVPVEVAEIAVHSVFDSLTWTRGEVALRGARALSCWVLGLPENCDCENVRLRAGDWRLRVLAIAEPDAAGYRQINGQLPEDALPGPAAFRVECGGVASAAVAIALR